MTHLRRLAALALGLTMLSPLAACDTDTTAPVDAGSSSDDSGSNSGQDASGGGGDTGVANPDSGSDSTDTGTSTDSGSTTGDAGSSDAGGTTDTGGSGDAGTTQDAGGSTDAGGATDAGAGMDAAMDTGAADTGMSQDMGTGVDYSNRPPGECVSSADCGGGGLICDREAAGGVCSGCGDCSGIPGPNTHTCTFGACVPDCSIDDDCPPGRTCNRGGLCTVERCTNDVCPVPWFVCSAPNGICQRATCFNNEPCPAQTTCTNGICVEDHSLP